MSGVIFPSSKQYAVALPTLNVSNTSSCTPYGPESFASRRSEVTVTSEAKLSEDSPVVLTWTGFPFSVTDAILPLSSTVITNVISSVS